MAVEQPGEMMAQRIKAIRRVEVGDLVWVQTHRISGAGIITGVTDEPQHNIDRWDVFIGSKIRSFREDVLKHLTAALKENNKDDPGRLSVGWR